MAEEFVSAKDHRALEREHRELVAEHKRLRRAAREIQSKAYAEGRDTGRRENLRAGTKIDHGDDVAHLVLPDNGGAVQFHVIGPTPPKPLTGGILSPQPMLSLRIWGPPDDDGSYGIHEQGGGNLTDFAMLFDLTSDGIRIHRMDVTGVRTRWDREAEPAPAPPTEERGKP